MLKIARSKYDRNSIIFHMDRLGAENISCCFEAARNGDRFEIQITLNLKKNSQIDGYFAIQIDQDERIEHEGKRFCLFIDEETLSQGEYLLNFFVKNNYFPIAEFCNVKFTSKESSVDIYFYADPA